MGCDIHLYAEAKINNEWITLDKWSDDTDLDTRHRLKKTVEYEDRFYSHGRNYNLFCALCGVRSEQFKGEPPTVSYEKGVPYNSCLEYIFEVVAWWGDGHSHSHNTLKELKDFDWSPYGSTCDDFRKEVITKLAEAATKYSISATDVRIVYFFDN